MQMVLPDTRSLRERPLLPVVLVVAVFTVVAAAYSNSLSGPFLWDDRPLIVENPGVRSSAGIIEALRSPFWSAGHFRQTRTYYRPVVTLSYAADYALWGLTPEGFHATNLVFHLFNVILLFAVARRWGASRVAAACAAALWGLAPRLTESVTWISGRTDVLAATPVLIALLVWDGEIRARRIAVAVLFGLGLGCKEVAAALVPALFVLEWRKADPGPGAARRAWVRVMPLGIVLALFFVVRQMVLSHSAAPDLVGRERPLLVLRALATFGGMILDPLHPKTQIGRALAPDPWAAAAGLAVLVLLVIVCGRGFRRLPPSVAAATTLALAALVPVLHIVPITNNVVAADRFLYLPLAGLALALAAAESGFPGVVRKGLVVAVVLGLSTFPFATHRRNEAWSGEIGFWALTIRETRWDNYYPRVEFGRVLFRTARWHELVRTLETIPLGGQREDRADRGYYDLAPLEGAASALDAVGRYESALKLVDDWARGEPLAPVALAGIAQLQRGDFEGARRLLDAGDVSAKPADADMNGWLRKISGTSVERLVREKGPPASLAARARLVRPLGGPLAEAAWSDVVFEPRAPIADRRAALDYLFERGERTNLLRAIAALRPLVGDGTERQELIERLAARDRDDAEIRSTIGYLSARRQSLVSR